MKTAVAAVFLACLHGSVFAAPLERGTTQSHAVHQRDTAYGSSDAFIAEREVVNDALRQLAENPVIKRQIDGLLANKDIMNRIALAIAASQQINKRDTAPQLDNCAIGDLFLHGLGGLPSLGGAALSGAAEGFGGLRGDIAGSGGIDADFTGGILGGDNGLDLGDLAERIDLSLSTDADGGLDLNFDGLSGGILGDKGGFDLSGLFNSFLRSGLPGSLSGGLSFR